MSRRPLPLLLGLAAIWGSSFMFIKVAVRELPPGEVVFGRVLVGAVALLPAIPFLGGGWSRTWKNLRRFAWPLLLLGLFNAALPFWLLAWSEKKLDSGLAAVLQASMPLFTAVFAYAWTHSQRVTGARLVGVVVGFLGVLLLVGAQPSGDVLSALAVLLTALLYAASTVYASIRLREAPAFVTSLGSLVFATLATLPLGVAELPSEAPSWKAIGSVVALGAVGLSVAYLLYFTLIAGAGAPYAALVTYLVPALALGYGAVFLDEPVTLSAVGGLLLILAGVALGTGTVRLRRLGSRPVGLLEDHVERFNSGVRSGDWAAMVEGFHDDAEMEFRGVPVGPFVGRDAIAAAYRDQPPDDELRVLEQRRVDGVIHARYAWLAEPDVAAGEMFLTPADGRIAKLVVTFDRGVVWGKEAAA
ncbi:MAG TPA: EamA family transporter [Gaiellaceae bacterium]|nr:EamA family transporter [Gaiellaceae bacterium]HWJ45069.1 EamA family transporter [Gaiellaceae bacterium]